MSRKRYSVEQIIVYSREGEVRLAQGRTVGDVCREIGVSEQSYYRRRKECGGLKMDQARRLKELERENSHLKRRIALNKHPHFSASLPPFTMTKDRRHHMEKFQSENRCYRDSICRMGT